MLFILDPDLIYKIDNNSNIQVVVSQIAYSRRKGHHIIYAEDKVFKFLASYEKLSSEARNIYLELYNNLSEAKSYLKYIKTKVHIVTNNIFNRFYRTCLAKVLICFVKTSCPVRI